MTLFLRKRKLTTILFATVLTACLVVYFAFRPFEQKGRVVNYIPLTFQENGMPYFQANIEGTNYFFKLDTGLSVAFSIKTDIINKIKNKKKQTENSKWLDVKGNDYLSPLYTINSIKINKSELCNITAKEESPYFISEGCALTPLSKKRDRTTIAGSMGSQVLLLVDYWLIDFPNSSLVAIKDIEKTPNFKLENSIEVHLEKISPLIVVNVNTEFGVKKFALDTGASHTLLKTPPEHQTGQFITTERFILGECDFGPINCFLFDITEKINDFDGIIGRDFFRKHAVLLDFKNQRAFIGI